MHELRDTEAICVVGLGYVGLPLAVQLATKFRTIGCDLNATRVSELSKGYDRTGEISDEKLSAVKESLTFTNDIMSAENVRVYIVAVPTPITKNNIPDLRPLEGASRAIGGVLRAGTVVVYESTVFPGCTEEVCVPILEDESGLSFNCDFFAGYSPERINPGDSVHTIETVIKVTSGSTPEVAEFVDGIYASIVSAGTFRAASIRVAEAAKVIENTQRDLNIAFANELAVMFDRLGLDTTEVLEAAGTKWNFLRFQPGLVGGHCIGVDPFYLTHKAQEVGHHPELILAGRRLNDSMGAYVASELVKLMIRRANTVANSRVLVLGITFKENCGDIRNTRVIDVVMELREYGCQVSVFDPWADSDEVSEEYGIDLMPALEGVEPFEGVVLAVGHREFRDLDPRALVGENGVVYDVKSIWPKGSVDQRL